MSWKLKLIRGPAGFTAKAPEKWVFATEVEADTISKVLNKKYPHLHYASTWSDDEPTAEVQTDRVMIKPHCAMTLNL